MPVFQGLLKWDPAAFDELLSSLETSNGTMSRRGEVALGICGDEREVDLR